jgi:hypothetical protein
MEEGLIARQLGQLGKHSPIGAVDVWTDSVPLPSAGTWLDLRQRCGTGSV